MCRSFRRAGDNPQYAAMVVRSGPQVKRDMRIQPENTLYVVSSGYFGSGPSIPDYGGGFQWKEREDLSIDRYECDGC